MLFMRSGYLFGVGSGAFKEILTILAYCDGLEDIVTSIASSSITISIPPATAAEASPIAQDHNQAGSTKAPVEAPATIVSLSAEAAAASSPPQNLPILDPDKVSNALSEVSGVNGLAFLNAHLDLSLVAAKFGQAWADGIKKGILNTEYQLSGVATSNATDAGIPLQSSINSISDLKSSAASESSTPVVTVADFSFKSGGSVYSVTNQPDGTLLGTKDGQAWQTWQLAAVNSETNFGTASKPSTATSDAANALRALTSLNNDKASSKALAPLDLSA